MFLGLWFLVVSGWVFPVVQFVFDLTPSAVVEHRVESDWTFLTKATSPREPPPRTRVDPGRRSVHGFPSN